ncbi:MAG: hypothetical protein WC693_03555 [Patescibacteria group bacterium]
MQKLYERMQVWQKKHNKRFLSISIQKDGDMFCCIALTNPSEVVITSMDGKRHANVLDIPNGRDGSGFLRTSNG